MKPETKNRLAEISFALFILSLLVSLMFFISIPLMFLAFFILQTLGPYWCSALVAVLFSGRIIFTMVKKNC
jgi:hypothetical protein